MIRKTTKFSTESIAESEVVVEYDSLPFKELCSMFSVMIISLKLRAGTNLLRFSKQVPYLFRMEEVLNLLQEVALPPMREDTYFTIKYATDVPHIPQIVDAFFEAHLLHCPKSRTADLPKPGVSIQPTAKGVAVLHSFCMQVGVPLALMPQVVKSSYNSMRLVALERDRKDRLICSELLLVHIFCKVIGEQPRCWTPDSTADPVIQHSNMVNAIGGCSGLEGAACLTHSPRNDGPPKTSPYHHPYFTNPDSDALSQYYTSSLGIRFHYVNGTYATTAKSMIQWVCDCTTVATKLEARQIVELLIQAGHVIPLKNKSGEAIKLATGDVLRSIKKFALEAKDINVVASGEQELGRILEDPGYKLLFSDYLSLTFRDENLEGYTVISKLNKNIHAVLYSATTVLLKHACAHATSQKLISVLKSLLFRAYLIYLGYFDANSPCQLNIPYELRNRVGRAVSVVRCEIDDSYAKDDIIQSVISLSDTDDSESSEVTRFPCCSEEPKCSHQPVQRELIALLGRATRVFKEFMEAEATILKLLQTDTLPNFYHSTAYKNFVHQVRTHC